MAKVIPGFFFKCMNEKLNDNVFYDNDFSWIPTVKCKHKQYKTKGLWYEQRPGFGNEWGLQPK